MEMILSRQNPHIKLWVKLAESARERRKHQLLLLEGAHLVEAALNAGYPLEAVFVAQAALGQGEISSLLASAGNARRHTVDDGLFRQLCDIQPEHGMVAMMAQPSPVPRRRHLALLLEDIQDPGNLGSMLRTAAAAGVDVAYLSGHCADAWSPKVLRGGMGAHFVLPVVEHADLLDVAASFSGQVLATSLQADRSLYQLDLTPDTAFIFGNEGAGVSAGLLAAATQKIKIPMAGQLESLNVAAAVAICLFERARQSSQ